MLNEREHDQSQLPTVGVAGHQAGAGRADVHEPPAGLPEKGRGGGLGMDLEEPSGLVRCDGIPPAVLDRGASVGDHLVQAVSDQRIRVQSKGLVHGPCIGESDGMTEPMFHPSPPGFEFAERRRISGPGAEGKSLATEDETDKPADRSIAGSRFDPLRFVRGYPAYFTRLCREALKCASEAGSCGGMRSTMCRDTSRSQRHARDRHSKQFWAAADWLVKYAG